MVKVIPAVLTSCSHESLTRLVADSVALSESPAIDIYLGRVCDLGLFFEFKNSPRKHLKDFTNEECDEFGRWLAEQILPQAVGPKRLMCGAFATYVPEIASMDDNKRKIGSKMLEKLARIAFVFCECCEESGKIDLLPQIVFEIVAGSCLEFDSNSGDYTIFPKDQKLEMVNESITEAIRRVSEIKNARNFFLSTEIEPGPSYCVSNLRDAKSFLQSFAKEESKLVGLNADLGHLSILRTTGDGSQSNGRKLDHEALARSIQIFDKTYEELSPHFVHAHISDHPEMHLRDQIPGTWDAITTAESDLYQLLVGYWKGCNQRQSDRRIEASGWVSLELEGCGRADWVYKGCAVLRNLIDSVNRAMTP